MKLLLIRHGDPDYTIDSLTPKGHTEAELLAQRLLTKFFKIYDLEISTLPGFTGVRVRLLPWQT